MSSSGAPYYYRPVEPVPHSPVEVDVCVYGATSGGVVAAIEAKRRRRRVVLLAFETHIGGLTSSGLGATDIGNKGAIGGLARDFYRELGRRYGRSEAWTFEPHVAEDVFREMLRKEGIEVRYRQHLASVRKSGERIEEITMEGGEAYRAGVFIDATYEGDLMAMAGVRFHVGREANRVYGEIFNGVHLGHPNHNFDRFVDPYKIAGDARSGLLAGIVDEPVGVPGEGDHRIQAYNFRMCLTRRDDLKVPIRAPEGYDPEEYTLLARHLATGTWNVFRLSVEMPNGKTDTNNFGAFSTDYIGVNHRWPEAEYAVRERLFQDHVRYTQGLFFFLGNDPRVPEAIRREASQWGLADDEFQDTENWPRELYIREARRMVSDYVMTEHDCVGGAKAPDSIGLAAYTMDSHNCRRIVLGGRAFNEGNIEIGGFGPYPISYRAVVPRAGECANLFVPFCLSASHVAFGSIRMEPVFMVLAQSAAIAADIALRDGVPVQEVPYPTLRKELEAAGQVL